MDSRLLLGEIVVALGLIRVWQVYILSSLVLEVRLSDELHF